MPVWVLKDGYFVGLAPVKVQSSALTGYNRL